MKTFEIDAIVEIPAGSMFKYEVDKESGALTVDRPLPMPLPYNYGYIPNTLHGDGDPLDACIIGNYPVFPLTKVKVVLHGAFVCDDNGESDDKLVASIVGSEWDLEEYKAKIEHYLTSYKAGFTVKYFIGATEAYGILMRDLDAFLNEQNS